MRIKIVEFVSLLVKIQSLASWEEKERQKAGMEGGGGGMEGW